MSARPLRLLSGFIASSLLLAASAGAAKASDTNSDDGWIESGEASWYGPRHAGHRTANGQRFNPNAMTAAHPSLPLGSRIRVTVKDTGRSVVVTVNDREPPHGVRCIDLSRAAAGALGIVNQGTAMVDLSRVNDDTPVEVAEAPDEPVVAPKALRGHHQHRHHATRLAARTHPHRTYLASSETPAPR
jgi:rare lipoprotein A